MSILDFGSILDRSKNKQEKNAFFSIVFYKFNHVIKKIIG